MNLLSISPPGSAQSVTVGSAGQIKPLKEKIMILSPALSKQVGWNQPKELKWPTMEQVMGATDEELLRWYRFLPSATNTMHKEVQDLIFEKVIYG